MKRAGRWLMAVSLLGLTAGWFGCNTGGGGGGGAGDNGGPASNSQSALDDGVWEIESTQSNSLDCLWIESGIVSRYFPSCGIVDTLRSATVFREDDEGTVSARLVVQVTTESQDTVTIVFTLSRMSNDQLTGISVISSTDTEIEVVQDVVVVRTSASTGIGSSDHDPLPSFQLDAGEEELDADVASITSADNKVLECLGEGFIFTEEDVLLALKGGYVADDSIVESFPIFVDSLVVPEQQKADEICDTTVENASDELQGWLDQLTQARNEGAACDGKPATLTNENSLELLKTEFFGSSVRVYATLESFAEVFVPDVEQTAEQTCAQ